MLERVEGKERVRIARPTDAEAITETISRAFHEDPTWAWAFPDSERRQAQYAIWWRLLIDGAMRYPWVLVTERCEVAAVWIPPDGTEIAPKDEARVPSLLRELVGDRAPTFLELLGRFDDARPVDPPHYYLSLLGVHDDHRGKGLGMRMLRENLSRFDALGMPTYLESSNRANNPKYESVGYASMGEFTTPDESVVITRYWREAA
jgi:GNAT superfamily N-acetyltransferase